MRAGKATHGEEPTNLAKRSLEESPLAGTHPKVSLLEQEKGPTVA